MCIPVDSMLWALVSRIRDEHHEATPADLKALLGSGCTLARAREVMGREALAHPGAPFASALQRLAELA